ncbi:MAG TPA: hypothetical protein VHY09_04375 [Candidatus Methylacidiphilales bacterium]|nr:hypothetical protein [Candidatus Methylacidiphilales bacterium]
MRSLLLPALVLALAPVSLTRADTAATNAAPGVGQPPTAASLVEQATTDGAIGKFDRAVTEATRALALDPRNTAALDLRGSVYMEKELWDLAERDYTRLNKLSPDPAYQYKLAQIKFLQKQYDDARPLFATLKDDGRLGDLARYKIFICDVFGAHEAIAARDIALLDSTGQKPSYYYGRAIWLGAHGQNSAASHYLAQAEGKFSGTLCALYVEAYARARLFSPSVATFTTRDGRKFNNSRVDLEEDGLRASTEGGWVTLPLDQLPDDLSPFPDDLREQIDLRRHATVAPGADTAPLSFTTRSGKSYRQVRWMVEDAGLGVLSPDGWVTVPFRDLPGDLSSFPAAAREQIAQARARVESTVISTTVSFTTRQGDAYDGVRAWLGDDGLHVLTANGPATVPFADLPADLSAFPAGWRPEIEARLKSSAGGAEDEATVSFTTQKGKAYQNVRAALGGDEVMILSSHGWTTVPFSDLPADLSPFPASWQPLIVRWLKSSPGDTSGIQVVSFTTRRGRHYDQVRATLDDKGLDVLGPNGWVQVSFDQVPDDLSPFPAAWHEAITAGQKTSAPAQTGTTPNN